MTTNSMDLDLPVVSTTIGPTWASKINAALLQIAEHTHASGDGVKVTPVGMNINQDLSIGDNNLTAVRTVRLSSQGGVVATPTDLGCIVNVNGDLYWVNNAGTPVQLTTGGAINIASVGTIGGDYGQPGVPASVSYSDTTKTFTFLQDTGEAAELFVGDLNIANAATGALSVSIGANAATASYALILPIAAPTDDTVLAFNSAGQGTFRSVLGTAGEVSITASSTSFTISLPSTVTKSITFSGNNVHSGSNSFTGSTSGRGILPLGAVIATMPHLTGAYACTATTAADSNGFVQCNGQTISDATSPMNGAVIPNINDDAFIRGNATSGSTGGSNANITLSAANLPAHAHDMSHGHTVTVNAVGTHTHTMNHGHSNSFGLTGTTSFASTGHTHGRGTYHARAIVTASGINVQQESVSSWTATDRTAGTQVSISNSYTEGVAIAGTSASPSATASVGFSGAVTDFSGSTGADGAHTHTATVSSLSANTGSIGSGTSFSVMPKYISARYIMRIK